MNKMQSSNHGMQMMSRMMKMMGDKGMNMNKSKMIN